MAEQFDFAVIGAGAAGMAAAIAAASCGDRVLLLEKSGAAGRKISASGNGRCNLMNSGPLKYFGDSAFAREVFERFPQDRIQAYWELLGLVLCEEAEGRMYPCTFQSATVVEACKIRLKTAGVRIFLNSGVERIRKEHGTFFLETPQERFEAGRVLIACGGAAAPKLGGGTDGYSLLEGFGHSIVKQKAALCPLTTDAKSISGLSGLRARGTVTLKDAGGEVLRRESGEILFTDTGISGICIMQTARFSKPGDFIELDLTSRMFPDREVLIRRLFRRQKQIEAFPPETVLSGILAPRLAYAVLKQSGIEMKGRKAGDLTETEIRDIARTCAGYRLSVTGNRGLEEAQVTAGGASCAEFRPDTMESRFVKGLHAAGEVLDVDGDCGGFNLMFATAGGILAGLNGREGNGI